MSLMLKKVLAFVIVLDFIGQLTAQTVAVKKFELTPFDLSAVSHETKDAAGNSCALLKVTILSRNIGFESNNLVRSENKGDNEYWVWLSPGAESVLVQTADDQPLHVVFAEYDPDNGSLEGKHTYQLLLAVAQATDGIVTVAFSSNALVYDLLIDGYPTDQDLRRIPLKQGSHKISARAKGFEDFDSVLVLNKLSQDESCFITMTPTPTDPLKQAELADKYVKEGNYARALALYSLSEKQGCAQGQNGLGDMYRYGRGIDKDLSKAVKYYVKAEKQGYTTAMINLGDLYGNYGDSKTYKKDGNGYLQYLKAAEAGDAEGWYKLCVETNFGISKKREFMMKGARMGHVGCQRELGTQYLNAKDAFQDDSKAFEWLSKAAMAGDPLAQHNLGTMYINGRGVKKDSVAGVEWIKKAAFNGDAFAAYKLGKIYEEGILLPKDLDLALVWYRNSLQMSGKWNNDAKKRMRELVQQKMSMNKE